MQDYAIAGAKPGANGNAPSHDDVVTLESLLDELARKEADLTGRTSAARAASEFPQANGGESDVRAYAAPISRERQLKRARDRRYQERRRARLAQSTAPVRPAPSEITWALLSAAPTAEVRAIVEAAGLTVELVRRAGESR